MLPLLIGGVVVAVAGYALKEVCEEENCFGLWDENRPCDNTETQPRQTKLEEFYELRLIVFDSHGKFSNTLKEIKNLKLDKPTKIVIDHDLPTILFDEDVNRGISDLYIRLVSLNTLLQSYASTISKNLKVSNNFEAYSTEAKEVLSDAMVLSNMISDILNVKVINKKGKFSKSAKRLLEESKKVLDRFSIERRNVMWNNMQYTS